MASGVWKNVMLSKTSTFDGVCGMLSFIILIFGYDLPDVGVFANFVVDRW